MVTNKKIFLGIAVAALVLLPLGKEVVAQKDTANSMKKSAPMMKKKESPAPKKMMKGAQPMAKEGAKNMPKSQKVMGGEAGTQKMNGKMKEPKKPLMQEKRMPQDMAKKGPVKIKKDELLKLREQMEGKRDNNLLKKGEIKLEKGAMQRGSMMGKETLGSSSTPAESAGSTQ